MHVTERLRAVVAILLLVGAGLFIVGIAVERAALANEQSSATHPSPSTPSHHDEVPGTEGSSAETAKPAPAAPEPSIESIFGVNIESWPLAIVAAILSFGIALAAWRGRDGAILLAVAVFAFAFAALDIRELIHQVSEGRAGIVGLAIAIALVHLAAAGAATLVASRPTPRAVAV